MTKFARYLFGHMNALTISVRFIDGEYWYMAADICRLLEIENHSTAVHGKRKRDEFTLEDHEWRKETIYIGGYGKKRVLLVNDEGMKKLIFQATSPLARPIQRRALNIPSNVIS